MRSGLIIMWLCLPICFIAWHYGPGQEYTARDASVLAMTEAQAAAANQNWLVAFEKYGEALAALPQDTLENRWALRRLQADAHIQSGALLEGTSELETLLNDMKDAPSEERDESALHAVRQDIGKAYYHAAWLMRLEGASKEEWMPEILQSRQQFRYVAERSDDQNNQENLEAGIRLQEMGLADLKGLALPKQCPSNCQNLSQRKRKQRQSKSKSKSKDKNQGKKEEKQDARDKVKKQNQDEAAQMVSSGSGS